METNQLYRGRLIDHIQLVVADLDASRRFYHAVLSAIGIPVVDGDGFFYADELFVSVGEPLTGRCHLAFQAKDEAMVKAFHTAGLAAGGRENGEPGERPYHPGYYAAFLLDPDGNNIEAVYHGPARQSAASILIEFDA
ncbi:VOC family protein [Kaistia dalseonensis]|uniref:Catechol 2,3-dioxygenase-like lactoylglutathione lyase family enzyme n=1 Tax=Kaistia dalseonensis TaxID=410840 RepID=A0ABU0HCV0_9HYPH|nr:VOC family protein [Kaistia dalseonensis]MCX5497513.1 VOC family protein [Kaistia dalseonensis]MDQ0440152.1 catechol 2,3-dioxygenase-like lactoylglutathione lyase family enzyme [Kaistia dalseonensis]